MGSVRKSKDKDWNLNSVPSEDECQPKKLRISDYFHEGGPSNKACCPIDGDVQPTDIFETASPSAAPSDAMDPSRKYGKQDPSNKNNFTCNFCRKVTKGGVYRLKQHLVGGFRNVTKCNQCPEHVRKEIRSFMLKKQMMKKDCDLFPWMPQYDENDIEEEDCDGMLVKMSSARSGNTKHKHPVLQKPKEIGSSNKDISPISQEVTSDSDNEERLGQYSSNIISPMESRDRACREIARWFYDAGIPFDAASYDSFQVMVDSIGQFGAELKPPSMHELKTTLLKKELDDTHMMLEEQKKGWVENGCSILCDGWYNSNVEKNIVNFLVNSKNGSIFLKSLDVSEALSEAVKNENRLFFLLDKMVEEVGEENVVQVVTDGALVYAKAGKLLEAKRPHLYWTPCAAGCINLMLEDIGHIPKVQNVLKIAIFINGYISNHDGLMKMMRRFTNQEALYKPAISRFATSFITLSEMHKQQHNLMEMVTSQEWSASEWSKEAAGKKMASCLLQERFWRNVSFALKLTNPLLEVLRLLNDIRKPAMGYIYGAMNKVKEEIAARFTNKDEQYKKVIEVIDKRWLCQLHRPLHAAGFFLNPQKYFEDPNIGSCEEVMKCLYDCIEKLVPELEIQDKIGQELGTYQKAKGLFGIPMAIRQRKSIAPVNWWYLYGASAPNLRKFAVRILSLTCSAMVCERSWDGIEHLYSKKRNKFAQAPLDDLVFVKYNRTLTRQYNIIETNDPLLSEAIDEDSEWLLGLMDDDFEDENNGEIVEWDAVWRNSYARDLSHVTEPLRLREEVQVPSSADRRKCLPDGNQQTVVYSRKKS